MANISGIFNYLQHLPFSAKLFVYAVAAVCKFYTELAIASIYLDIGLRQFNITLKRNFVQCLENKYTLVKISNIFCMNLLSSTHMPMRIKMSHTS